MMMQRCLQFHLPVHRKQQFLYLPSSAQRRSFWEYVNMMFNKPDLERRKLLGPDRTCAEWVLRNGGKIIWVTGKTEADYNALPPDNQKVPNIAVIDGSNSSISHYGFPHLSGCSQLQKIIIHNCSYIEDKALKGLEHGKSTLTHVQISRCTDVSDTGIKHLKILDKLEELVLFELQSVDNLEECITSLKSHLPKCKIEVKSSKIAKK